MTSGIYGLDEFKSRQEPYQVISGDVVRTVDVCVIGSGAAGAILATNLAKSGKSVILLERGGYYDGESMNQREADMIPLLWKDAGANFTSNLKIAIAQGSCLGGSTVINDAVCFEIPDVIIDQWQKIGVSITKAEWNAANSEVSKRINVTKVTKNELNENAKKLQQACNKFTIYGKPIAHRVNHRNCGPSFSDKSLTECVQCGYCHLGCHYNTKQSMLVTYIHDALHDPDIDYTAYCNCNAEKITYQNGIASGINGAFVDSAGNEKYRIRVNAKIVIVSAGSIASSNLLQRSNIGGKNVGKGLALHPAPFVIGKFNEKIHGNRGIPMSYTCHEFGVTNGVKKGGFLIESIFLPVFQMAIAMPGFGLDHFKMMHEFPHYAMAGVMIRDDSNGIISLSYNNHPKVTYQPSRDTLENAARGMAILANMWFDVGATSVLTAHRDIPVIHNRADIPRLKDAVRNNPDGLMLASAHPQGGNKMGDDPEENIVDSDCKVYGFDNLYVCDASVFPTALGVNPQLTIMALATIISKKIINNWNHHTTMQSFGNTCDLSQPRFCNAEAIGDYFVAVSHKSELFSKLENSKEDKIIPNKNWKFDKDTLQIYNNLYWRGFYGRDYDALTTILRYFGGFYKRFQKKDATTFDGVTHPFETQMVNAKSIATEKQLPGYETVVHLKYADPPYSSAYDLLKMVDENTIIGKAFMGEFGRGRELFNFSMSRIYDIDFLTEDDLLTLFNNKEYSHVPTGNEMSGKWEGMLVSDSALSPKSQVFQYESQDGLVDMRYSFANMLAGRSDLHLTEKIFRMDDYTPFHDEIRLVTDDIAVGRWVSDWSDESILKPILDDFRRIIPIPVSASTDSFFEKITHTLNIPGICLPKEIGTSFLNVEKDKDRTRIGLLFLLKRVNSAQ